MFELPAFVISELSYIEQFFTSDVSKMLFVQCPSTYARPTMSYRKR